MQELSVDKNIEQDFQFLANKKRNGLGKNYGYIQDITELMVDNYESKRLLSLMMQKLQSNEDIDERYCAVNILGLLCLRLIYYIGETNEIDIKSIKEILTKLESILDDKDPFVRNIAQYYLLIIKSNPELYRILQ